MDLGISTGQHFRTSVGSLTLVDINLDDLVAEPVGKPQISVISLMVKMN